MLFRSLESVSAGYCFFQSQGLPTVELNLPGMSSFEQTPKFPPQVKISFLAEGVQTEVVSTGSYHLAL